MIRRGTLASSSGWPKESAFSVLLRVRWPPCAYKKGASEVTLPIQKMSVLSNVR